MRAGVGGRAPGAGRRARLSAEATHATHLANAPTSAGAVLYHFIEYPLEVKATLEYDETASILKQVENLTDIATVTRIETPLIQEFEEVDALEKNMNFTRIGTVDLPLACPSHEGIA